MANLYFFLKQQEKFEFKKDKLKNYYKPLMLYVGANVTWWNQSVIKIIKFYNYLLELIKELKEKDKNIYEILDEKLKWENSEVAKKLKEKIIDEINKNYTYWESKNWVYDLLKRFFNAENILEQDKINFHLLRWSNSKEDIVVANIWNNKPFMAIYIGDENSLFKILEEELWDKIEIRKKFSDFIHKDYNIWKIAEENNDINVLIWTTKKFGVGYDNYRISTIWLLNIDKSNIEAVQLFWRWVRLKWCKNNWKRCYIDISKEDKETYFTYKLLETLYVFSDSASALESFLSVNDLDIKLTFTIDLETDFENLKEEKLKKFNKLKVLEEVVEKQDFVNLKEKIQQEKLEQVNINNWKNIVIKTMSNILEEKDDFEEEKNKNNFKWKIKVENWNHKLLIEFYKTKLNLEKYLQDKIKKEFKKRFKNILKDKDFDLSWLFDNLKVEIEKFLNQEKSIFKLKNDIILDFKEMFSWWNNILSKTISWWLNLDKIDKNYLKIQQIIDLAVEKYMQILAWKIKNHFISYEEEDFEKKQKDILWLKSYSITVDIKDFLGKNKITNDWKKYLKEFLENIWIEIKNEENLFKNIENIFNNSKLKEINLNKYLDWNILKFEISSSEWRNFIYLWEHLYNYLYSTQKNKNKNYKINIKPDLVESEIKFIEDLKEYLNEETNIFIKNWYEVFIVRNVPKKWVWFYQKEFEKPRYPDFILWLVPYDLEKKWLDFEKQEKIFIEPHWIHNEDDLENLAKLPDSLEKLWWKYFILAPSSCEEIQNNKNIICMEDNNYIEQIFTFLTKKLWN